ncbi:uncharacterized protein LOC119691041 [Plutella xylostella]|uniref:uncharacterized protein LOC119691041 n=1 Tax=Plutella xylostella TaxID=51655 RepID=UPI0020324DFA|nr:uncharacterized protein LOC119691041 [Plutella xylostella]
MSSSPRRLAALAVLAAALLALGDCSPLHEAPSLGELGGHVARAARDPRLPLPSAADIEAIKKVAQILAMLGEQVIPAIIGQPAGAPCDPASAVAPAAADPPNDPVDA